MSGLEGGGLQRVGSRESVHSTGSNGDKKAGKKPGDGKSADPKGGEDDMKAATTAVAKKAVVKKEGFDLAPLRALAKQGVPKGTVTKAGVTNANTRGTLIRFAPVEAKSTMGDGYFAGGAKLDSDKVAVATARKMAEYDMDPGFQLVNHEEWNSQLGASIAAGVSMTVSSAGSDGTMGGVLKSLDGTRLRLLDAGQRNSSGKDYAQSGKATFNKLGQTDLSEMDVRHETPTLGQLGRDLLGSEFAALPDTKENRALLTAVLADHLTREVSHQINS
ncbi:hypothetical protein [Acanthopleuribacter pedis]|uniref:Uncharacterized protein n=1 Tax=Acanthopleuribacter pedis TaxID=442870 RepID=A0A8J7U2H7_9BACT|nr:hypothetical protein [Acanthopleuribacter pedis]MBO1317729.1 hypothetical protein [Acanthopleuribacter pedis]